LRGFSPKLFSFFFCVKLDALYLLTYKKNTYFLNNIKKHVFLIKKISPTLLMLPKKKGAYTKKTS
jgi:hypothetical protein